MNEVVIPRINILVNTENEKDSVVAILKSIRPNWKSENVQTEMLTGGHINRLLCCHLASDGNRKDAVVVRIYSGDFDNLAESGTDVVGFVLGHTAGCSSELLAIFDNGIVYEYAPGRPLTYRDIFDPKLARLGARALAKFHSVDLDSIKISDDSGRTYSLTKPNHVFDNFVKLTDYIPREFDDPINQKRLQEAISSPEEWAKELAFVKACIDSLNLPVVVSHSDMNYKNFIYDESTETMKLIDFELIRYGCEPGDLSQVMTDKSLYRALGWCKEDEPAMDKASSLLWLRPYLECQYELRGKAPGDVTDAVVEEYYSTLYKYSIVVCYGYALAFFSMSSGTNTALEWFEVAVVCADFYFKHKREIMEEGDSVHRD